MKKIITIGLLLFVLAILFATNEVALPVSENADCRDVSTDIVDCKSQSMESDFIYRPIACKETGSFLTAEMLLLIPKHISSQQDATAYDYNYILCVFNMENESVLFGISSEALPLKYPMYSLNNITSY